MAKNFTARAPAVKESVEKNSASKKPGLVRRQTNLYHVNPEVRLIGPRQEVYRTSDPAGGGTAVPRGLVGGLWRSDLSSPASIAANR